MVKGMSSCTLALKYYNDHKFKYVEIGDGDELWENAKFEDIRQAHSHLFWLMREFHKDKRLCLIWGNHNSDWKKPENVRKYLYEFYNERKRRKEALFEDLKVHEGLVFRYLPTGDKIFVFHGHQGDLICDRFSWFGKFCVRHFWRHLQLVGVRDRTSPAKNFKKRKEVEQRIIDWIKVNDNQVVICGHTHRSVFSPEGGIPYYNTGSCVHPRCITGIEISKGKMGLIKWWVRADGDSGMLRVAKDLILDPVSLRDLFRCDTD